MGDYYILRDGKPVEATFEEMANWREQHDEERKLRQETVGDAWVSTVFLTHNHAYRDTDPPVLWETLVFDGKLDNLARRYSTRAAALRGHAAMVQRVRKSQGEP